MDRSESGHRAELTAPGLRRRRWCAFLIPAAAAAAVAAGPARDDRLVFELQPRHVHSSSIVECPNGDLLCAWFEGSGERQATDVAIRGARLRRDAPRWSPPFPMADVPEFPDLNPVLFVDARGELWLFWITVPAERWEESLLRFRKASDYLADGPPVWYWQDDLLLKPDARFADAIRKGLDALDWSQADYGTLVAHPFDQLIEAANDLAQRQRGWMPRTHLLALPGGRMLLPLYSDGYYMGLMAISDDGGARWRASAPIVGIGLNQPSVVRRRDGTLVAYMRREGPPPRRVQVSASADNGETWSPATASDIPNPNSSLEVIALRDGRWVMAYNASETLDDRSSLTLALSSDEGASWRWKRDLERAPGGRFHYPSLIQARDERIHITYTFQPDDPARRAIKHVALDADWIAAGETAP